MFLIVFILVSDAKKRFFMLMVKGFFLKGDRGFPIPWKGFAFLCRFLCGEMLSIA